MSLTANGRSGLGYNLFLVSLAAALGTNVETMHKQFPSSVSLSAVYLQVYALQGYAFAFGTMFGPLIGGALLRKSSWMVECGVLAVIVATATLPVVSSIPENREAIRLMHAQALYIQGGAATIPRNTDPN